RHVLGDADGILKGFPSEPFLHPKRTQESCRGVSTNQICRGKDPQSGLPRPLDNVQMAAGASQAGLYATQASQKATFLSLEDQADRKSTRLNSSHVSISYAV